jgi:hypothetical protein
MIYNEDPKKQMGLCLDTLKCLEDLLHSLPDTDYARVLCGVIRDGLTDACIRLENKDGNKTA